MSKERKEADKFSIKVTHKYHTTYTFNKGKVSTYESKAKTLKSFTIKIPYLDYEATFSVNSCPLWVQDKLTEVGISDLNE